MKESEIADFVKSSILPIPDFHTNSPIYRCSATLTDGLYLPCVCVKSRQSWVKLAVHRFQECRDAEPRGLRQLFRKPQQKNMLNDYTEIVSTFVCGGNRLNRYQIRNLAESPFAIPPDRMAEIKGETSPNWTQFTVRMRDGTEYQFGSGYSFEFFDMPEGYAAKDIVQIEPAALGTPRDFENKVIRERPFFDCYVDGI